MQQMSERLGDPDVKEFVSAVTASYRLGTQLSDTLLRIADQIRLRRTQQLEAQSGKAQTMIIFPGFILMVPPLIILVAPFVLSMLKSRPF
jgi:pilus assembly protein TadC